MEKGKWSWKTWAQAADIFGQPLPGVPLVELAGQQRVLIENHQGVLEYGEEQIRVKVKFGSLVICGETLQLCHMTRCRLVIYGRIRSLSLEGGD